jgi:hypothetical protein
MKSLSFGENLCRWHANIWAPMLTYLVVESRKLIVDFFQSSSHGVAIPGPLEAIINKADYQFINF